MREQTLAWVNQERERRSLGPLTPDQWRVYAEAAHAVARRYGYEARPGDPAAWAIRDIPVVQIERYCAEMEWLES